MEWSSREEEWNGVDIGEAFLDRTRERETMLLTARGRGSTSTATSREFRRRMIMRVDLVRGLREMLECTVTEEGIEEGMEKTSRDQHSERCSGSTRE